MNLLNNAKKRLNETRIFLLGRWFCQKHLMSLLKKIVILCML